MSTPFQQYPRMMHHPMHEPAKFKPLTPEQQAMKVPAFMKPVPECIALERFPPVTVHNLEQEKEYASKGYRPNNISDPAEYERALLESTNPDGYVFHAYPKWKYSKIEMAVVVNNKDEEDALVGEWFDQPVYATDDDLPQTPTVTKPKPEKTAKPKTKVKAKVKKPAKKIEAAAAPA